MKLLTELGDEQCLVQMHRAEMAALVVLGAIANVQVEGQAAPTAAPEPTAPVRATVKPHKGVLANGTRPATCVECGKSFKRKTCEKTCSRECRLARERKQKTAWSRGKRSAGVATKTQKPAIQASVAPEQNQSGSALSTSDRLELIRKRAAAMGVGRDD